MSVRLFIRPHGPGCSGFDLSTFSEFSQDIAMMLREETHNTRIAEQFAEVAGQH
jgi:hypothetical protein